jgi:hypothetical protein
MRLTEVTRGDVEALKARMKDVPVQANRVIAILAIHTRLLSAKCTFQMQITLPIPSDCSHYSAENLNPMRSHTPCR